MKPSFLFVTHLYKIIPLAGEIGIMRPEAVKESTTVLVENLKECFVVQLLNR